MIIDPKMVRKPWGLEEWLCDGQRMPYALKRITFHAGHRSSLQVHHNKKETNLVLSGTGQLEIGRRPFPIDAYLLGTMDDNGLQWYMEDCHIHELTPGMVFDVTPCTIHRITAMTDLVFIEASTPELDDVIRLHDDTGRANGRIASEHG